MPDRGCNDPLVSSDANEIVAEGDRMLEPDVGAWLRTRLGGAPARLGAWLRGLLAATPSRLRLAAALCVCAAVLVGVVGTVAAAARRHATDAVATRTEPLLGETGDVYAALSDADAVAAATFLTGGIEPAASRRRYLADLRAASARLTELAGQVEGSSKARASVATIATELPVYAGLIETARANNRQGLPIGAAYLRQASELMRGAILPAARDLYEVEARRLDSDYRAAVSTTTAAAAVLALVAALAVLVGVQLTLTRLTNRTLNVPLVGASVALVALLAWVVVGFAEQQHRLSAAQRDGSDPVEALSATRVLLLRAEADESLALVARGGGDANLADLSTTLAVLGPPDGSRGLIREAAALSARTGPTAAFDDFTSALRRYERLHGRIARLEAQGRFDEAVDLAEGSRAAEKPLADRMSSDLEQQIGIAQGRFTAAATAGRSALSGLWLGIPLLALVVGVLSVLGVNQRLAEYR